MHIDNRKMRQIGENEKTTVLLNKMRLSMLCNIYKRTETFKIFCNNILTKLKIKYIMFVSRSSEPIF